MSHTQKTENKYKPASQLISFNEPLQVWFDESDKTTHFALHMELDGLYLEYQTKDKKTHYNPVEIIPLGKSPANITALNTESSHAPLGIDCSYTNMVDYETRNYTIQVKKEDNEQESLLDKIKKQHAQMLMSHYECHIKGRVCFAVVRFAWGYNLAMASLDLYNRKLYVSTWRNFDYPTPVALRLTHIPYVIELETEVDKEDEGTLFASMYKAGVTAINFQECLEGSKTNPLFCYN